jgi:hypothetical protein
MSADMHVTMAIFAQCNIRKDRSCPSQICPIRWFHVWQVLIITSRHVLTSYCNWSFCSLTNTTTFIIPVSIEELKQSKCPRSTDVQYEHFELAISYTKGNSDLDDVNPMHACPFSQQNQQSRFAALPLIESRICETPQGQTPASFDFNIACWSPIVTYMHYVVMTNWL